MVLQISSVHLIKLHSNAFVAPHVACRQRFARLLLYRPRSFGGAGDNSVEGIRTGLQDFSNCLPQSRRQPPPDLLARSKRTFSDQKTRPRSGAVCLAGSNNNKNK